MDNIFKSYTTKNKNLIKNYGKNKISFKTETVMKYYLIFHNTYNNPG